MYLGLCQNLIILMCVTLEKNELFSFRLIDILRSLLTINKKIRVIIFMFILFCYISRMWFIMILFVPFSCYYLFLNKREKVNE